MSETSNPFLGSLGMSALTVAYQQLQSSLRDKKQEAVMQAIAMELGAELARESAAMMLANAQTQASQQIASGIAGMMSAAMTISSHCGASFIKASRSGGPSPNMGALAQPGSTTPDFGLGGILQGQTARSHGEVDALMKITEAQREIAKTIQGKAEQALKETSEELAKQQEEIAKMLASLVTGNPVSRG
jgi:hypothetical protein